MVSGFTIEKLGLHAVPPYWFIVRWETGHNFSTPSISRFAVHMLSDSLQIYFFHSGEEIKKYADSLPNFAGCMWKEAFGKKKLQIQKYSDISGRGVSASLRICCKYIWCQAWKLISDVTFKPAMAIKRIGNTWRTELAASQRKILFATS